MYICVCRAVTERHIHAAVRDGAKSMKDLRDTLGVGTECGSCGSCAKQCLREAKNNAAAGDNIIGHYAAA